MKNTKISINQIRRKSKILNKFNLYPILNLIKTNNSKKSLSRLFMNTSKFWNPVLWIQTKRFLLELCETIEKTLIFCLMKS